MPAQMQGACDPAQVDPALTPTERVAAHLRRAGALISLGRLEEAQRSASAAIEVDPQNAAALMLRARIALSMGGVDAGERDLNAVLLVDPYNSAALASRALLHLGRREAELALRDVTKALETTPDDVDALWIKARVYIALDQTDRAADDLTRALGIEPDERRARLLRAQLRLRQGQLQTASEDATILIDTYGDTSALEVRAIANTALDRPAEALADLDLILGRPGESATAALPQYHELLLQRAVLLAQLGRQSDAAKDVDTLVRARGKRGILRLQIYLRQHGFPDLPVDGERTSLFDEALRACLVQQACARGLSQRT